MTDKITFDLVSPEKLVLSTSADMVTLPGADGDMGVMAGHMSLISTLRPGIVTVSGGEDEGRFYVSGGFAEVTAEKVTVLAQKAMTEEEAGQELMAAVK